MLRNQAEALIRHERIETTVPKAKELRPFVERIITIAKRGLASGSANGGTLHARRLVLRDIQNRDVVGKLFDTIAPRFEARPGGYTRILRLGYRRGDSAEVAQIELVGSEYDPNAEVREGPTTAAKPKSKGVGGRLRAAAEKLRGKPKAEGTRGRRGRRGCGAKEGEAGAPRARQGRARPTRAARARRLRARARQAARNADWRLQIADLTDWRLGIGDWIGDCDRDWRWHTDRRMKNGPGGAMRSRPFVLRPRRSVASSGQAPRSCFSVPVAGGDSVG